MRRLRRVLDRWRADHGRTRPPVAALPRLLDRRAMLTLRAPVGQTVCCLSGVLWITVDGRPEDVVLGPDEQHRFTGRARAIVSALEAASVAVLDRGDRLPCASTAVAVEPVGT